MQEEVDLLRSASIDFLEEGLHAHGATRHVPNYGSLVCQSVKNHHVDTALLVHEDPVRRHFTVLKEGERDVRHVRVEVVLHGGDHDRLLLCESNAIKDDAFAVLSDEASVEAAHALDLDDVRLDDVVVSEAGNWFTRILSNVKRIEVQFNIVWRLETPKRHGTRVRIDFNHHQIHETILNTIPSVPILLVLSHH